MKILVSIPCGEVMDTFLPPAVRERLEELGEVTYNDLSRQYTRQEMHDAAMGKDVVVIGWGNPALTDEVIADNDTLKLIVHTGGSVADYVDESTYAKGIRVVCGNKLFAESVAEGTIAYMLSVLRHIPDQVYDLKRGVWKTPEHSFDQGLLYKKIGILGVGAIARFLMEKLQAFHCSFLVWDDNYTVDPDYLASLNARQTSLEEVLTSCPIITLHASLTPKSFGMIGRRELEMIQHGGIFINTARGAIVKQDELTEVLTERPDLRAMLDVYHPEPLPVDDPLRKLKNVYLMPHRGGPTVDFRATIGATVVEEIAHFIKGELMDHEVGQDVAARMTTHTKL